MPRTITKNHPTNADVLAGEAAQNRAGDAYRALVELHGHDALCRAYGLDEDHENGGTYWTEVIYQAALHGDIDDAGNLT